MLDSKNRRMTMNEGSRIPSKSHARSHQELHGCFPILKLHHVVQSCDEDRLVITFAAFYIAKMLPAYICHPLRVRQFHRFLEQKVYK